MAVFTIDNEFRNLLIDRLKYFDNNLDIFFKQNSDIKTTIKKFRKALDFDEFLLIKGLPFLNKNSFESFVKQFGNKYYGLIEHTDIKLDCPYYGCTSGYLEFHNDNAIDINYPKYGFIQVIKEDPLKLPKNGIVKVKDIKDYLELYNQELLDDLLNHNMPMLSYGIYYDSDDKKEIFLNKPILYYDGEILKSRFDLSRIRYYYWKKNKIQSIKERKIINDFLEVCKKLAKYYYLEKGDILIHNNRTTLHDRTECSFELNVSDQNTREIYVSFIYN